MLHYVYGMHRVIWHSFSRFHGWGGRGDNLSILLLLPWQLQLWTSKICRHSGILHLTLPWIVLHVSFFWKRHQLLITFPFQPLIDYTGKELKAYRAHLKKKILQIGQFLISTGSPWASSLLGAITLYSEEALRFHCLSHLWNLLTHFLLNWLFLLRRTSMFYSRWGKIIRLNWKHDLEMELPGPWRSPQCVSPQIPQIMEFQSRTIRVHMAWWH